MMQNPIRKITRRAEKKPAVSITLRIPNPLYDQIRLDLERPHPFAAERVGFLFVRTGAAETGSLLLLGHAYHALADECYIDDPKAGARIDSGAIREAMQRTLDGHGGVFHVHMHDHNGKLGYSRMDTSEQPKLVVSFQAVSPTLPHGTLVLSRNNGIASAWLPEMSQPINIKKISTAGAPMRIWEEKRK